MSDFEIDIWIRSGSSIGFDVRIDAVGSKTAAEIESERGTRTNRKPGY